MIHQPATLLYGFIKFSKDASISVFINSLIDASWTSLTQKSNRARNGKK